MTFSHDFAVTVQVPATSANLGPGFDTFGLALAWYDEVTVRITGEGLDVQVDGEGADDVPRGAEHLVARAMLAAFDRLGERPGGVSLHCRNAIPHGRGLGSSAAAVVAGVLAANALASGPDGADGGLSGDDVLELAANLEGHPDNVAACLAGGLTIAWIAGDRPRSVTVQPDPAVVPVACVPEKRFATADARRLLPATVPHPDAARNAARAALLVTALTRRPDLLFDATEDLLHQPYRTPGMPATAEALRRLRTAGVPAVISGAGPAILALTSAAGLDLIAEAVGNGWRVHRLNVDRDGARVHAVGSAGSRGNGFAVR